jgi:hypothetical protein
MSWEIIKFVAQAAIAVSGAFLAAYLATRRYRQEKWWDKQAAAYGELIDALHRMKWPPSEHLDAQIAGREVPAEESARQWDEFKTARRNVWRIADGSAFLVSSEVYAAVQQLERDLSVATNAETYVEHLDEQHSAVQKCLLRVKEIGRRELRIGKA